MKVKTKKNIEANTYTIEEFLKENVSINIPRYQREYSWNKKNISMLLNDINEGYYIGNIISFSVVPGNREIIDGQQRLITTFLILIALSHCVKESSFVKKIHKLILFDGKCKLALGERIGDDGKELLNYLINSDERLHGAIKKYNEVDSYKFIKKEISKITDLDDFYRKLIKSCLVDISFIERETQAHEMFVNVNTKGKPLSKIEVLKSKLFQYLLASKISDSHKEKWQEMLSNIPKKDYDAYVSESYLFYKFLYDETGLKTNGTTTDNYLALLDLIDSKQKALAVFNLMAEDDKENIYRVYSAIKNHNINSLVGTYFSEQMTTSMDKIHNLWKLYEEFKFEQSDIMFVSLFRDKEALFLNHNNFVYSFMLYTFLYEIVRSIIRTSPSNYSNSFKSMAMKLSKEKNPSKIKQIVKEFIKDRKINTDLVREKLLSPETFVKSYKSAKFIIMLAEKCDISKLTVEHFIPQKTSIEDDKKYIGCLGNLIPVVKDRYKSKPVAEKLEMYKEDMIEDTMLASFMRLGVNDSNYKKIIEKRTEIITSKFIALIDSCYDSLTKK